MLHGRTIKYNQIAQIPGRHSYLDPDKYAEISDAIRKGQDLLFMPNAIHEMHIQDKKYDPAKYKIVLWGVLRDGRRASVILNGIVPYFEVRATYRSGTLEEIKTAKTTEPETETAEAPESKTESEDTEPETNPDDPSLFAEELFAELKNDPEMAPLRYEINTGRKFKGFSETPEYYVRFYFNKLKHRENAIRAVREMEYETVHDDSTCYFRVVCRDARISLNSWCVISDYKVGTNSSVRGDVFSTDIRRFVPYAGEISSDLAKDNSMVATWDIETWSPDGSLPVPEDRSHRLFMIAMTFHWYHSPDSLLQVCIVDKPCAPHKDYLTIVCETEERVIKAFGKIFEKMKPEFLMGFNDSDYDWKWLVVRASQTKGLLTALAKCMDATFPWQPYTDSEIYKYKYVPTQVKVEATLSADGASLQFPGYINLDVRTIFRQMYPTAEKSSLNWFLQKNKLLGKKDMPYQEMFKIYRRMSRLMSHDKKYQESGSPSVEHSDAEHTDDDDDNEFAIKTRQCRTIDDYATRMREVAEYCVIDARRCHELMLIRMVIMERRKLAELSYTSLYEAFYRANGAKVRNLVIAESVPFNLKISNRTGNIEAPPGKYPGAYVFKPKKGLVVSKLTMRERKLKAERYRAENKEVPLELAEWLAVGIPTIEICEQFIAEHVEPPREPLERFLEDRGISRVPNCIAEFFVEKTGRPITGLDFSSLYPSLIMTYNLSPEYMITDKKYAMEMAKKYKLHKIKFNMAGKTFRAWSVAHENKMDPKSPDYRFGIYPKILKDLFDKRKQMKKTLAHWESQKEAMESMSAEDFNLPENKAKYENIIFNFNCIDATQKALKVFMNTFYGETGNKLSPFFLLELAGGITTLGKRNIKLAHNYVSTQKCGTLYGDTDSLYLSMPEDKFADLDRKYFSNRMEKLEYWKEMVYITFREIQKICDGVNDMFAKDNGTDFLRMAFEESLFPVDFLAKKKYYGVPHISTPNFNIKHLFVRGLEVKKRGVSQFLRNICTDIMNMAMSCDNADSVIELVKNKIHEIYNTDHKFEDFAMTDVYKPPKPGKPGNIKVVTFANRMMSRGIKVKPWDRFSYVIVKKNPYEYDHRGRKTEISVGDKMEYLETAHENKMEIDLDYYMKGGVNGQLARFIAYHPMFYVAPEDGTDEASEVAEAKIYKNASKFVDEYCSQYYTKYNSKGHLYKKVFKVANKIVSNKLKEQCDPRIVDIIGNGCDLDKFDQWLCEKAEKQAKKETKQYGEHYVAKQLKKYKNDPIGRKKVLFKLQEVYFANKNNLGKLREALFGARHDILMKNIAENMTHIKKIFGINQNIIESVSRHIKTSIKIDDKYNEPGADVPGELNIGDFNTDDLHQVADSKISEIDSQQFASVMASLKFIYINLICNYVFINQTYSIVRYLKELRNQNSQIFSTAGFDKVAFIKNAIDDKF